MSEEERKEMDDLIRKEALQLPVPLSEVELKRLEYLLEARYEEWNQP